MLTPRSSPFEISVKQLKISCYIVLCKHLLWCFFAETVYAQTYPCSCFIFTAHSEVSRQPSWNLLCISSSGLRGVETVAPLYCVSNFVSLGSNSPANISFSHWQYFLRFAEWSERWESSLCSFLLSCFICYLSSDCAISSLTSEATALWVSTVSCHLWSW